MIRLDSYERITAAPSPQPRICKHQARQLTDGKSKENPGVSYHEGLPLFTSARTHFVEITNPFGGD
jgi:hypothetical protein